MDINKILGNKNFTIITSLILAAYVGLINSENMPSGLLSLLTSTIGKIVILVLIAYLGDKAPTVSLMLAIALCVTLSMPNTENFYNAGENSTEMDGTETSGTGSTETPQPCTDYTDEAECNNNNNCNWEGDDKKGKCVDQTTETTPTDSTVVTGKEDGFYNYDGHDGDVNEEVEPYEDTTESFSNPYAQF